jgi:hypothetical protein
MKQKLVKKLQELLKDGYETINISQVLEWISMYSRKDYD